MDLSGLRFPMSTTTEQTTELSSHSSCGNNWQSEYAQLHRKILTGRQPPRYLIALGTGGLADSLAGAITLFWVALLTNRAFLMDMGDGIKYEFAYDQPTINWSLDTDSIRPLPSEMLQMVHGGIVGRGRDLYDALEGKRDLHRVLGDTPALFVKTNFGRSIRLFSSTYHNTTLFGVGVTPQTAFGCAFSYLLRLNNESLRLVADEFASLNDPDILGIGIQIREGDQVMKSPLKPSHYQITTDDNRRRFLDCAGRIERQVANIYKGKRQIMWYLLSDSIKTRREMKNAIGDRIIVNIRDDYARSTRTGTAFQIEGYYHDGEFRIRDKICSLNHTDDLVHILAKFGAGI